MNSPSHIDLVTKYSPRLQSPSPSSIEHPRAQMMQPRRQNHIPCKMDTPDSMSNVRVISRYPEPRCWEHGCNGRRFSTFSNLLRHQREKSRVVEKSSCPNCGVEFTRTTARNGHMSREKCKKWRLIDELV